ncbi:hypothetical protein LSH36_1169g00034 [Paralvinella palmiformis]|uniref:Secreted protein n=1 Tax=Paralvinella palmiformis TaxID=53620 RepID=A0AAD9MPX5_9ANNE|nr:hypothetical protein LSH36_1169g00034 [Paralvinella palmiformis]
MLFCQCFASSDLVLLLSVFITDSLPYLCDHTDQCANPWKTWPYVRYVWIMTPISQMSSIWFVVLIALNRHLGRLSAAFPQHDLDQSANTYLCQLRSGAGRVVQRAQVLRIPNHRRVRQLDELHSSDGTEH